MTALYPDDYVRIRSVGSHGDGGMDGYLRSSARVHQCYGSLNGAITNLRVICKKISEDFDTAVASLGFMKEWCFTHNMVVGMPTEVLNTLTEIEAKAQKIGISTSMFGPDKFQQLIPRLPTVHRTEILGEEASVGPSLEVTLPSSIEPSKRYGGFAPSLDVDNYIEMLKAGLTEVLDSVPNPIDLLKWTDAANALMLTCDLYKLPIMSYADIEKYRHEFERFHDFFGDWTPDKLSHWVSEISSYFVSEVRIANVGDDHDSGIEVNVALRRSQRKYLVPQFQNLSDVRDSNALAINYPRPTGLEFNDASLHLDYIKDAHQENMVRDTPMDRKYAIARLDTYKEIVIPICVRIGADPATLDVEVYSRKTGQRLVVTETYSLPYRHLSENDLNDMIDRCLVVMPIEQAHIMRLVIQNNRELIQRRAFEEMRANLEIARFNQ